MKRGSFVQYWFFAASIIVAFLSATTDTAAAAVVGIDFASQLTGTMDVYDLGQLTPGVFVNGPVTLISNGGSTGTLGVSGYQFFSGNLSSTPVLATYIGNNIS